jgi:hypothetical protein
MNDEVENISNLSIEFEQVKKTELPFNQCVWKQSSLQPPTNQSFIKVEAYKTKTYRASAFHKPISRPVNLSDENE